MRLRAQLLKGEKMNNELTDLRSRLKDVIVNTCNKIGCANCDLKFDANNVGGECAATDLENRIHLIRVEQIK